MSIRRLYRGAEITTPLTKAIAQTASRTTNGALSGDPVRIGSLPGVATKDCDSSQKTVVELDGIHNLLVSGIDSSGTSGADANVAVAGGDIVYFDESKTPPLSKRSGGVRFGYAFGDHGVTLVASGATTTRCPVKVGY